MNTACAWSWNKTPKSKHYIVHVRELYNYNYRISWNLK